MRTCQCCDTALTGRQTKYCRRCAREVQRQQQRSWWSDGRGQMWRAGLSTERPVDITPDQIEECYRKALQWIRWERSQGWR